MTAELHVGVIGIGRMGAFHVQTLQALQSVASLTVADTDSARAHEVAGELGVTAAKSPESLVASGVDAVVIATATPGHAPLVRLAASNGIPAFCEKPVALDLVALDDVLAAVEVLRLSDGGLGILSGTRLDPLGYDVRLEVFGARDSIAVGFDARSPIRSVEPGAAPPGPGYRDFLERFEHAYGAELAEFVRTVSEGGESACPLPEARAALVVALAADRSRA